jgi:signal peptidase I
MSRTRAAHGLRETALWFGAALGLLAVAAGLAVTLFSCSFLVFRSGSMSPVIDTGALALARPVDAVDLAPGDVVSVRASDGSRITHRVVDITVRGDEASLVLQGDANGAPDAEVYTVRSVERVEASAPYLGYVVAYALTPTGLVAMAAVCLMLVVASGPDEPAERQPRGGRGTPGAGRRPRGDRARKATASAVVTTMVVGGAAATGGVTGTWAAFNDGATMRTGTFSGVTVAPPTNVVCVNSGTQDFIRWNAPAGYTPVAYRVYVNGSSTVTATVIPPTRQWTPANTASAQTFSNVRVTAVRVSWESVVSTTSATIRTLASFAGTTC